MNAFRKVFMYGMKQEKTMKNMLVQYACQSPFTQGKKKTTFN